MHSHMPPDRKKQHIQVALADFSFLFFSRMTNSLFNYYEYFRNNCISKLSIWLAENHFYLVKLTWKIDWIVLIYYTGRGA